MEILTITAEVEITNPIQVMDVCDAIIEQMKELKDHANKFGDEITLKSGNLETVDDELVGDWAIAERRKGRR
jgi:hypothetical protein